MMMTKVTSEPRKVLTGLSLLLVVISFPCFVASGGSYTPLYRASLSPSIVNIFYNTVLLWAWSYSHSLIAQREFLHRHDYTTVACFSIFAVTVLYQPVNWYIWTPAPTFSFVFSLAVYTACIALVTMSKEGTWLGMCRFFGLLDDDNARALPHHSKGDVESNNSLISSGLYSHVRHPMYTGTLASIIVAPEISLDRLCVFVALSSYLLLVGIPLEEKRLKRKHGDSYVNYATQVPWKMVPNVY